MSSVRAGCALLCLLVLPGCLFETTLNATGGGEMRVLYPVSGENELPKIRKMFSSDAVTVTKAEMSGPRQVALQLKFDDVTRLSTTTGFRQVKFTRTAGKKAGTMVLTATYTQDKPFTVPDKVIEAVGKELKVTTTFPGKVLESNGTVSGDTVTWTHDLRKFYEQKSVEWSATFEAPAVTPGATAAASPAATAPPTTSSKSKKK